MGGVPKGLKIKCNCGDVIDRRWNLKGIFEIPEYNYKHEYYLSISKKCDNCGKLLCIYRDRHLEIKDYFVPIRIYLNFLDPNWNHDFDNVEMVAAWQDIFKRAASKDMDRIQALFPQDIMRFRIFLQEIKKLK